MGAVNLKGLFDTNLANGMMKAETKSKRRATLDLLGLGMLDEEEVAGAQLDGDRQGTGGAHSAHDTSPDANPQAINRDAST